MLIRTCFLRSTVVAILGFGSAYAIASPISDAMDHYLEAGHSVRTELATDQPSAAIIIESINAMLQDAKTVVPAFSARHVQCAAQLTRMLELYPQIDLWNAQEIRRNIEGGASLPQAEGCYAARDVVAHPAIVRALARTGIQLAQRARLTREIDEAIEHMEEISQELGQE